MSYMGIPICRGNVCLVYRPCLLYRSNGLVSMGRAVIRRIDEPGVERHAERRERNEPYLREGSERVEEVACDEEGKRYAPCAAGTRVGNIGLAGSCPIGALFTGACYLAFLKHRLLSPVLVAVYSCHLYPIPHTVAIGSAPAAASFLRARLTCMEMAASSASRSQPKSASQICARLST